MNKKIFSLITLALSGYTAFAQLAPIPTDTLPDWIRQAYIKEVTDKLALDNALKESNQPEFKTGAKGETIQAMYVTATGHIVYNTTHNIGAGRTLSTNKVWPGGNVGVSLTGAGLPNRLGVWDGGRVRTTHQEFGGRVTQTDGAGSNSDHATHVAATMVASGVSANAKGMSYMATLKSYDWNNDVSEMIQAAQAGMLISNHSYGNITGWNRNSNGNWEWYGDPSISQTQDYKFGLYDDKAAQWDQVALNYPNYLICKSAGNDRGDNKTGTTWYYPNGALGSGTAPEKDGGALGFDCISTYSTAKNILTVGAVNKIGGNTGDGWTKIGDVVMSAFSGWGPTDDGRIKPDVVAPGVSIYSATASSNTGYDTYSGTSMATPATSGSLLLVQQHYNNIYNKFMRSASLKGLAIHTADEAGNVGPDYKFGWGLLNIASSIQFINDSNYNKLEERIITNGQTQNIQFNAEAGKPLRITICWTDIPGTPVSSNFLNNPTKMLVHDLDIRLTRQSDNMVYRPYVLNPLSPNSVATTGDNITDNVEMIHLATPASGMYVLTISHKGSLRSNQPFSLLISNGVEKSAALFSSNKTVICPGQTINFTDNSTGGVSSRVWYFPGGSPSTSTAINPIVTYATPGTYPVALKTTSALGSDSIYKENYVNVGGLPLPFTENFESSSPTWSAWQVANPDADYTWAITDVNGANPANKAAFIRLFSYSSTGQRDGLISPPIGLGNYAGATLTFSHAYTMHPSMPSDSLIIYGSIDCGNTWIRVAAFAEDGTGSFATYGTTNSYAFENNFVPSNAGSWCDGAQNYSSCKTISLTQFAGQPSVLIKFESYNNYSNNLYLDNISITGTLSKPEANFTAAKTNVCTNEPIQLNDESLHLPSDWYWVFEGATETVSTQQNPQVVYANPGIYSVKLIASNSSGHDTIERINYITVVEAPTIPNLKVNGPVGFCLGDSVLLSTDSLPPFKWYADNELIAEDVQSIYAITTAVYRVARSNSNCEVFSAVKITAGVKPDAPTLTSSLTGSSFCEGGRVVLTSSSPEGNIWFKDGVEIPNQTNRTLEATEGGSYAVVVNPEGCPSDLSLPMTYSILPRPVIESIDGSDVVMRNEDVVYTVNDNGTNTYQWSITNGIIVSGASTNKPTVRFTGLGNALLSVTARSASIGCLSIPVTKNISVGYGVGLSTYELTEKIKVYPVPANNQLFLSFNDLSNQSIKIQLINVLGQVLQQSKIDVMKETYTHQMDVSSLPAGVYFIEAIIEGNKLIKRVVIE
jgi:PKD repeat protein